MNLFERGVRSWLAVSILALALAGCGGGGGADGDDGPIGSGAFPAGTRVAGTVARGAPVANAQVICRDVDGERRRTTTDASGAYELDVGGLTGPLLIKVEQAPEPVFTVAADLAGGRANTVNVHPLSDLVARNWYSTRGRDIAAEFDAGGAGAEQPQPAQVAALRDALSALLALAFGEFGLAADFNFDNDPFAADGTLFDRLLDHISVRIERNAVTIVLRDPVTGIEGAIVIAFDLAADFAAPDTQAPEAFAVVAVVPASQTEMVVVWNASRDNVGVAGYRVFRDGAALGESPFPVLIDTGLGAQSRHCYAVEAFDAAGNTSPRSAPACATTLAQPDTSAPAAPEDLRAASSDGQRVDLTWDVAPENDVLGYHVYRSLTPGVPGTKLATVIANRYSDSEVSAGTEICYQVRAFDGALNLSEPSAEVCITPQSADPRAPRNTTAPDFVNGGANATGSRTLLLTLAADDDIGVTGYFVADNARAGGQCRAPQRPLASDPGWEGVSASADYDAIVSYAVSRVYTDDEVICVYVWFRDADGRLSSVAIDSIAFEDSSDPVNATAADFIDGGSPATSSRSVSLALSASDDVAVTGYYVADAASGGATCVPPPPPATNAPGWTAVTPAATYIDTVPYTLGAQHPTGTQVCVHVWFRDGGGNLSDAASDSIVLEIFRETFQGGTGPWFAENGVWQVGTPSAGPPACASGTQCLGTVLAGAHPVDTDSRFIGPGIDLPALGPGEEIHLRFQHWFSYASNDAGQVQVAVWDAAGSAWGNWVSVGAPVVDTSGWSLKDVELTAFAGQRIRLGFLHTAADSLASFGWYIDDIEIVAGLPRFTGDFETGWDEWGADVGVWQVGTPTRGPAACATGNQCAGTELDGAHGVATDSRLVGATMRLPAVDAGEEVHLRFQTWFSYSSNDSGQVQVAVWDDTALTWGAWTDVGLAVVNTSGWSLKDVELTAYAGRTVRLGFLHTAADSLASFGWYIDDIEIVAGAPAFSGDFEAGWDGWGADGGVWQVGTPTAGPAACATGDRCAGTELGGAHGVATDSRLIGATLTLPAAGAGEEVHLRFQNWFSYSSNDFGQVQVSVWDPGLMSWGAWTDVGEFVADTSGWSLKDVELTAYAGETVRLGFFHTAADSLASFGWYIDDVEIVAGAPVFAGDFESGWDGWGAERGVWQIGTPTRGPAACATGNQCAGTELDGAHGVATDSRLVGATLTLPAVSAGQELRMRFEHWFSYSSNDAGQVQVSVRDGSGNWGDWADFGAPFTGVSGGWTTRDIDLTALAGATVRIAFFHSASDSLASFGWYVDDVQFLVF